MFITRISNEVYVTAGADFSICVTNTKTKSSHLVEDRLEVGSLKTIGDYVIAGLNEAFKIYWIMKFNSEDYSLMAYYTDENLKEHRWCRAIEQIMIPEKK